MKKALNSPVFPWLLVFLWAAAIFLLSSSPDPYGLLPKKLFTWITRTLFQGIQLTKVIGLLSHIILFGILGVLLLQALAWSKRLIPKHIYFSMIISLVYALSDEVHQLFVPSRAFQWIDILLDSLGILLGLSLYVFLQFMRPKAQEQQQCYE